MGKLEGKGTAKTIRASGINTGRFFFLLAAPTAADLGLSHRKPASAGTSYDTFGAQDSDKNTPYLSGC